MKAIARATSLSPGVHVSTGLLRLHPPALPCLLFSSRWCSLSLTYLSFVNLPPLLPLSADGGFQTDLMAIISFMRLKWKLECGVSWGVRLPHGIVQDRSRGDVEGC